MTQFTQAQGMWDRRTQLLSEVRQNIDSALRGCEESYKMLSSGELTQEAAAKYKEQFDKFHADYKKHEEAAIKLGMYEGSPMLSRWQEQGFNVPQPQGSPEGLAPQQNGGRQGLTEEQLRQRRRQSLQPPLDDVPFYVRPMGSEDPNQPQVLGGDPRFPPIGMNEQGQPLTALGQGQPWSRLEMERDGFAVPADAWEPNDPRARVILSGRARRLANKLLRLGRMDMLSRDEMEYLARERQEHLMSPFVDFDGGMFQAEEFRNEVIGHVRDITYIRARARVIPTNASKVSFPTGAILLKLDPTKPPITDPRARQISIREVFGKKSFDPKGESKTVRTPEQFLADETFDVISWVAQEIAANDVENEEQQFLHGDGKSGPLGVVTALQALVASGYQGILYPHSGAGGDFSPKDLKQFPYKLRKAMRTGSRDNGAAWTVTKEFLEKVSVIRTEAGGVGTSTGDFLFRTGTAVGDPDTLVGYPILETEFLEDKVTAGNPGDIMCLFGNWWHYWIVDRKQLTVRILKERFADTDEVGYKYEKSFDGALTRAEAFIGMTRT